MDNQLYQIILAVAPTLATALLGYVAICIKHIMQRGGKTDTALRVLLRREIDEMYDELKDKDAVTIDELHEFDEVYEIYAKLGGNGRGKMKYNLIHRMEIKT